MQAKDTDAALLRTVETLLAQTLDQDGLEDVLFTVASTTVLPLLAAAYDTRTVPVEAFGALRNQAYASAIIGALAMYATLAGVSYEELLVTLVLQGEARGDASPLVGIWRSVVGALDVVPDDDAGTVIDAARRFDVRGAGGDN